MIKNITILILFFCLGLNSQTITVLDTLKAFNTAEGWGKNSTGAREKSVYKVINLNDSGAGSLRQALSDVSTNTGGYIEFEISGTIIIESTLTIPSNTYIAGQTAFRNGGQGITIRQNATYNGTLINVSGNNSVIRYIRLRRGQGIDDEVSGDCALISGNNLMFDHVSFSWSTDEIINPIGSANTITFQNYIFSEALLNSTHAYTTDETNPQYPKGHSMGGLINGSGVDKISFYRGLFAHNNQRNPLISGQTAMGDEFEFVNTYFYNWGSFGTVFEDNTNPFKVNIIGSKWKRGSDSSTSRYGLLVDESDGHLFYVSDNLSHERTSSVQDEWLVVGDNNAGDNFTSNASTSFQSFSPFSYPITESKAVSVDSLETVVLPNIGASLYKDAVDTRVINDAINGTGAIIDDPSDVGGYPTLSDMSSVPADTDDDGMPDDFETEHGITDISAVKTDWYFSSDDHYVTNTAGYTNIEMYLMSLTGELLEGSLPYYAPQTIKARGGKIRTNNGLMRIKSN